MRLTRNKIIIPKKPYITERLDSNTVSKLLDSSFFVVDGIYRIKQDVDSQVKLFQEEKVGDYTISAYVKINYAYAGPARAQVKNVIPWRDLILRKPSYELRINLYGEDHISVYHFDCKYTNIDILYQDIEDQTRILEEVIYSVLKQN